MKKRILGLVTAAAMTTAIMPQVVFADGAKDDLGKAPAGVWYNVNNSAGYGRENFDITYSTDAYEGNYALRITNINEIDNRSILTKINFKENLKAGETYRVSFMHYSATDDWTVLNFETLNGHSVLITDEYYTSFPAGWSEFTTDFTVSEAMKDFHLVTWKGDRLLDNLSVCKVNTDGTLGENLVINGDFETIKVRDEHTQYPSNWSGWYNNGYSYASLETFIASTAMDSYTGDRSMMVNVEQEINNKTYTAMTYLSEGLKAGKNYKFEMYMKNISREARASFGHEGNVDGYGWGYIYAVNGTDMGNGWYKITKTISGSDKNYAMLKMTFWPGATAILDDVSVYEVDADGNVVPGAKNLVINGDFEDVLAFDEVDPGLCYNNNWKIITKNIDNAMVPSVEQAEHMRFAEVAPGNYALHVSYDDYEKANTFVKMGTKNKVAIENGVNYTVEYDLKYSSHNYNGLTLHTLGDWKNGRFGGLDVLRGKIQSVSDDGWIHCKTTVDSNSTATEFTIEVGAYCEALIDNIKVYRTDDETKTNLIPDGDFSGTVKRNATDLDNVIAYSTNIAGTATVSWTNAYGDNEDIKVYVNDIEQDVEVNAEDMAFNQVMISDLTQGETYEVKVTATVNGVEKEYVRTLKMKTNTNWYNEGIDDWGVGSWGTFIRDNTSISGYTNTNINLVTDEKASGKASVRINSNMPDVLDNVYAGIEQTVQLERNKLYRVTFKAKGENVSRFKVIEDTNVDEENHFWTEEKKTLTGEWTEYTTLLDANENANGVKPYDPMTEGTYLARILLSTDQSTGSIWIDDVEVYEVDPDDTVTKIGENLLINGGFETPELVLGDAVFSVGGEVKANLVAGTMDVSVAAENEGDLILVVALYKDGALYSAEVLEKSTSELSEGYNTSLSVPSLDTGVYTAKVFYWNGAEAMSAYRLPVTIAE